MSSITTIGTYAPTPGSRRRTLLTDLAAELHRIGAPALIAHSSTDHPVLYTVRDGRRVAVLAVEYGGTWWFIWGKENQVTADRPDLAARFLGGAKTAVTSLMDRRPRPRGSRAHLPAVA
ncbi:hypothetical protein EKD16_22540 [Streptomonospora litoralis]|uniref:Uncharacterized protein n=1 Tax=Streptomonospora litoralis TaxID=2498135 RepID=A0A4P6Q9H1_9ACTN|nr:hypothetical protein EKD16_22540 [Streptomonospora litoralis]